MVADAIENEQKIRSFSDETMQEENKTVQEAEMRYVLDETTGLYQPSWVFIMETGDIYNVNALTGKLNQK